MEIIFLDLSMCTVQPWESICLHFVIIAVFPIQSLMPWIQLGRFRELYVAQATDVILYKSIKYNGQLSWQHVRTYSGHHRDICKFVVRNGQLVSSSMDNSIRSWDLQTGKCKDIFRGHSSDVNSVDCFDDVIVSGSKDKTVKVGLT